VGAPEKIAHRLGEVPQRLLLHRVRSGRQPLAFGASGSPLGTLLLVARRLASSLPVLLLLHGQIPHKPGMATMLGQYRRLLNTRKQPKPAHTRNIGASTDKPRKEERGISSPAKARGCPAANPMKNTGRRSTALGYALIAPSLFGVVTFLLLPILVVVWLSLHRWDLLGPIEYVGGQNWRSVLTDKTFGNSLLVTLTFVAIVVPVQTALGLAVGALLARDLPGSGLFRTIYVLPWISVPLAIAVLWRWILAPTDGAVSTVLGHRIEWLTDPGLALPVVSAVVVWTNVGYVALFFLAGILAIPAEIHSAARIDGATSWQRFRRITLPMLRPTMFFVLVTGVISAAQVFDTVYALTGGGPQNRTDLVAHRIYAEAFGAAAIGRASVMAVVLFVILVTITLVQHLYFRKRVTYDLT
jgi:multiple sugar transport system permease protein